MGTSEGTSSSFPKGGTGKPAATVNLGAGTAKTGNKVLLVDAAPQAGLTIALGNPRPDDLPDLMAKVISVQPVSPGEDILHHPEGGVIRSADCIIDMWP